jgi:hypothetical protein
LEAESAQAVDLLKLIGVILGGYGAILSTYNFIAAHYGRLIVEYRAEGAEGVVGRVRLLCIGRPRFIDDVVLTNKNGQTIKVVDVGATMSRGESRRIMLEDRSFRSGQEIKVIITSERKVQSRSFTI